MGWFEVFRGRGAVVRADTADYAAITEPYDVYKAIPRDSGTPVVPIERADEYIMDEIKRRQISLAIRYVAAVRAR